MIRYERIPAENIKFISTVKAHFYQGPRAAFILIRFGPQHSMKEN